MLFNSATFLFVFLPSTLAAYLGAMYFSRTLAKVVLIVASIIFYTVWNPANLPILLGSTFANYALSLAILKEIERDGPERRRRAAATGLTDRRTCGKSAASGVFQVLQHALCGDERDVFAVESDSPYCPSAWHFIFHLSEDRFPH
jgi:hypothetical protein